MTDRWVVARPRHLRALGALLLPQEHFYASLTSRLCHGDRLSLPDAPYRLLVLDAGPSGVAGCVLQSRFGFHMPVLPHPDRLEGLDERLGVPAHPVHSIMGRSDDVEVLSGIVRHRLRARVDYLIMRQEQGRVAGSPAANLVLRRAQMADLESLMPLQRGYELEEVLLGGEQFDYAGARAQLRATLKGELTSLAMLDGRVVAKASTNATGVGVAQIGGVYTVPELRGRGIAQAVVGHLCDRIRDSGRIPTLFVKTGNVPAIRAYQNLGFSTEGPYRIMYYWSRSAR